jgi:proteasome lid subunit RPN8/RPN11/molybdopterin converting factor small subunit
VGVNVYIPTSYRRLTGGQAHVGVELGHGQTLARLVECMEGLYPGLKDEIWDGQDFKHYVNVYVNGEEARALEGVQTPLSDGDEVAFVPMLAGGAEALVLTREVFDGLVEHARRELPNECCGMLAGRDSGATLVHPMTNVEASPVVYRMDPAEQLRFYERLEREGLEEVAAYHSHVNSPAYPSATDVRLAHGFMTYLIVSLQDRDSPSVRAFQIDDGGVRELEVQVR